MRMDRFRSTTPDSCSWVRTMWSGMWKLSDGLPVGSVVVFCFAYVQLKIGEPSTRWVSALIPFVQ